MAAHRTAYPLFLKCGFALCNIDAAVWMRLQFINGQDVLSSHSAILSFCHQRVCSVPSRPPSKVAETCDARKRTVHVIHSALFCVSYGALLAMGCLWTYSSLRWLEQLFILLAQNSVAVSSMHKRCHLPHLNSP